MRFILCRRERLSSDSSMDASSSISAIHLEGPVRILSELSIVDVKEASAEIRAVGEGITIVAKRCVLAVNPTTQLAVNAKIKNRVNWIIIYCRRYSVFAGKVSQAFAFILIVNSTE